MAQEEPADALHREQDAFDSQLPQMLPHHSGEYVVFKDGKPAGFFPTYQDAYEAALDSYGLDGTFLVSEVAERPIQSVSIAWDHGVMFA